MEPVRATLQPFVLAVESTEHQGFSAGITIRTGTEPLKPSCRALPLAKMSFFSSANRISARVGQLRRSLLVRNTVAMMAGSGARLLIQGGYFVLIARALGAEQYGAFVGVVALVGVLAPFAPLGTGQILIRNVARDRETFRHSWGNALWMTSISGSLLLGLVLLLARFLFAERISLTLVLLVGISDLLLAAVVGVGAQAFQAIEELHLTARVYVVLTSARAATALVLILAVRHPTAMWWGLFYCVSSAVACAYAVVLVSYRLGYPRLSLRRLRSDLLEGFYFAVSLSSQSIYNNIDKTMLVRLATFGAAGIYAAAYRLVDLSFQPVGALAYSTYARFFQHGTQGLASTTRFARRLLPYTIGYGVLACAALVVMAPLLPPLLGPGFQPSVQALRWLSPLVLFKAVHYFLADSLTGAGFQGLRSGIQVVVAGLNVLLNFWLIPTYSWRGAAWASLASDGALAVGMFAAVTVLGRRNTATESGCGIEPRVV
jgi:O-antigen/teichoic acid export membrane protein